MSTSSWLSDEGSEGDTAKGHTTNKPRATSLTLREKLDIAEKLSENETIYSLALNYQCSCRKIYSIYENKSRIIEYAAYMRPEAQARTRIRFLDSNLNAAVFDWWCKEVFEEGKHVTDSMILKRAILINSKRHFQPQSNINYKWVSKFKAKRGIRTKYSQNKDEEAAEDLTIDSEYDCGTMTFVVSDEEDTKENVDKERENLKVIVIDDDDDDKTKGPTVDINQIPTAEEPSPDPTAKEVFNAFDTVLQWAKFEPDVDVDQLLFLRKLQSNAARKALATRKK